MLEGCGWISWIAHDTIRCVETFPLMVVVILALIFGMFFLASLSKTTTTKIDNNEETVGDILNKSQKKELKRLECTIKYEK